MAYTKEQIQNIVRKAYCCAADLAYILLNTERFNTNDKSCARKKLNYINQAVNTLCRYEPVRGIINATYTVQVITQTPSTQEITLSIKDILVIDHIVYTGTADEIADQLADDINEFIEQHVAESLNSDLDGITAIVSGNNVFITYDDIRRTDILFTYSVDDLFITQQSLIPINVPIPAITETCLTDDQIQNIVEQLNKVCGCCDCQDNLDIIKDIT